MLRTSLQYVDCYVTDTGIALSGNTLRAGSATVVFRMLQGLTWMKNCETTATKLAACEYVTVKKSGKRKHRQLARPDLH